MNKSETIKELALALSKAQAEMPPAELNAVNPFLKNKYADLGSVIKTAKPVLAKHELAMSQLPISNDAQVGVTTILMHSSGEWIETTMMLHIGEEKGKTSAQVAGSIISYLRRYSLASILGMYADEDIDGDMPEQKSKATESETIKGDSLQAVVDAGYFENIHAAKVTFQKYCRTGYDTVEKALDWGSKYRGWRDTGKEVEEAAQLTNEGKMPK